MKMNIHSLTDIASTLQALDLQGFEETVERLNAKIDNLPYEARVRCTPTEKTFQLAYVEPGMRLEWIQEDEDYARQCADEKWRSRYGR